MNQNTSQKSLKSTAKYIVTPGLIGYFFEFLDHCRAAESSPIMILGPTGVGKSLFLHLYKKFFENEERSKDKTKPIIGWANCAHFGGVNSDPNIARAELFGQKKGSSSHAERDKKGLVGTADGGALILEEIGELPLEVQAMLLTFIESGEYREVGGTETKFAKVHVVGATNREEALREDFKYRFFPFYLPSLHTRRADVLYYLSYMHPNLLLSLTKSEVLVLLAYNWPGNVREIDRVARLMYRDKIGSESIVFDTPEMKSLFQLGRFSRLDERETQMKGDITDGLLKAISHWGCDSELLESLLNRFNVGLSNEDSAPAFKDEEIGFGQQQNALNGLVELENEYDVNIFPPVKPFEDAFRGYLAFCGLFMQDPFKNTNVLERLDDANYDYFDLEKLDYPENNEAQVVGLAKAIMQYLKVVEVDGYEMPEDLEEYWNELNESIKDEAVQNDDLDGSSQSDINAIFDMSEDELRKFYYSEILKKSGGNVKAASKIAGLNQSTFRSRLINLGMISKRNTSKRKEK